MDGPPARQRSSRAVEVGLRLPSREGFFDSVRDAVGRLDEGHGSIVFVIGESGSGRTVLLDAACAEAERRGIPLLRADPDHPLSFVDAIALVHERSPSVGTGALLIAIDDVGETDPVTRAAAAYGESVLGNAAITWLIAGESDDLLPLARDDVTLLRLEDLPAGEAEAAFREQMVRTGGTEVAGTPVASLPLRPLPLAETARLRAAGSTATWPGHLVEIFSADDQQVLASAALLGNAVDPLDVADVLGRPIGSIAETLVAAVDAGVLHDDGQALRFSHHLVRRAFADRAPAHRAAITRRIVDVFLARDAATRLTSGVRSGWLPLTDLAEETLLPLADLVAARDPGTAARVVRHAIGRLDARDTDSLDALFAKEASFMLQSGDPDAAQEYTWMLDTDPGPELAFALAQILFPGHNERSRRLAERSNPGDGSPIDARLSAVILAADSYRGRATVDACERVDALAAGADDSRARDLARIARSMVEAARGDLAASLRQASLAATPPRPRGASPEWWKAGVFRSRILADLGRIDEAETLIETLLAAAQKSGQLTAVPTLLMVRGLFHMDAGRLPQARLYLDVSRRVAEGTGLGDLMRTNLINFLAHAARMTGDTVALSGWGDALQRRLAEDEARRETAAASLMFVDDAVGSSDGVDRWARWAENITAPEERPHYSMATGLADAVARLRLATQRGLDQAAARIADSLRILAATTESPLLTAAASHADGLETRDAGLVRRARSLYIESGRPLLAAQAAEDVGALETEPERRSEALRDAESLWTAAGARREAARVGRSLRELGRRGTPGGSEGLRLGLTPAEDRVVLAVMSGATNQQVAQSLMVSPNTVAVHLRRIFVKTGVRSRQELILLATDALATPSSGAANGDE